MTINLSLPQKELEIKPRITVIGVGGAGGNAVNNMISAAPGRRGIHRRQHRRTGAGQSLADRRVQLGITITEGLGAGARPEVGRQAAEEALPEILRAARRRPHGVRHRRHGWRHRHRRRTRHRRARRASRASSPSAWSPSRSTSRDVAACSRPSRASWSSRRWSIR